MRTVKVVVIGSSGVGKTSIRNQYVSGRFTTGYRATIGADFITKTLPHYRAQEETVNLQIWDTAGQERFSSLSSAFFRGADAAILMFDVNQPETLQALTRWWSDFRDNAPVRDDEAEEFCCVVVGNKVDMLESLDPSNLRVTETDALQFLDILIPPSSPPLPEMIDVAHVTIPENASVDGDSEALLRPALSGETSHTKSIDIVARHMRRSVSKSRSRSRSLFQGGTVGTMTTTHTVYHTPSSSFFDAFESALSSPVHTTTSITSSPTYSPARTPRRQPSSSSVSSVPTITPSLFLHDHATTASVTPLSMPSPPNSFIPPAPPERRPKLFFTSAKTGQGVSDVFEYVARRVVMQWEYEEALDARTLHMQDADETIRLTHAHADQNRIMASCCGS